MQYKSHSHFYFEPVLSSIPEMSVVFLAQG